MDRREFVGGALALAAVGCRTAPKPTAVAKDGEDVLDVWQRETDQVSAATYEAYMRDGDTRGLASLEKLEAGFEKILREVKATKVGDVPAVWSVYNMGYVVKTRESLFSIDLVHRRALELAPMLDFALITHNHDDHYRMPFYQALDRAGKTVISNFLDNYGAADWRKYGKGDRPWYADGGFTRAEKTFKIKDVEISTSLVDHNAYLIDFTTAFEVSVGNWRLYHSGDCGISSKLRTLGGAPDLWLFFPGCGVDVGDGVRRIRAKRTIFGHLWELGHGAGRLTTPMIRDAVKWAASAGAKAEVPLWGTRIS